MKLQHVRYFLAICEERNFTRAARKCRVRQPSLSTGIQRLEKEIGGALFVRSHPVELSALGAALHPLFAQMNDIAERVCGLAAAHPRQSRPQPSVTSAATTP